MSDAAFTAMSVSELQDAKRSLLQTIASGTLSTRFADGSMVVYRSHDDLVAALQLVERLLAALAPAVADPLMQSVRSYRFGFASGYRYDDAAPDQRLHGCRVRR